MKNIFYVFAMLVNFFWVGSALAQVGEADEFTAKMIGAYEVCKDIDDFTKLKTFDREVAFLIAKFNVYQNSRLKKEVEKGRRDVEKVLDLPVIHCGMALAFMVGTRAAVFANEIEVTLSGLSEFDEEFLALLAQSGGDREWAKYGECLTENVGSFPKLFKDVMFKYKDDLGNDDRPTKFMMSLM